MVATTTFLSWIERLERGGVRLALDKLEGKETLNPSTL
jgi:hypothetical protein